VTTKRKKDGLGNPIPYVIGDDNGDPGGPHDLSQAEGIVIWHGRLEQGRFTAISAANRVCSIMAIDDFVDAWYVDKGYGMQINQIVQQIGDAAGKGKGAEIEASQFLNDMGNIMSNISGAFDSSIWGLALMVTFLVVIGLVDRLMQRRLNELDRTIQNTVIPGLSELQLMRAPNLSIGDLIDETSTLLTDLNQSVEGMTAGMTDSLSELSEEINKMMQDFGSFQNQYAQLNDLINNLKDYTQNVEDVTAAIESAGHTLANPISDMNRDLNNTIRDHMSLVGDAIEASDANREALANEFQNMEQDLKRLTTELRDIARDTLEQVDQHQQHLEDTLEKQHEARAATIEKELDRLKGQSETIQQELQSMSEGLRDTLAEQQRTHVDTLEAEIERLEAQSDAVQDELQAVAEALESADSQELSRVLDALEERLDESARSLSSSAGQLTSSAQEISESADRLERATKGIETKQKGPVTFFDWVRRTVEKSRNGR